MNNLNPLISALKVLISTGLDFGKALAEVGVEFFYLMVDLVKGGLSLLS